MMKWAKNKLFKTHLCFVLSIILTFAFILSGCAEENNEVQIKGTKLSLGDAVGLAGDTVKVPLSLSDNCGVWGGQIVITFDSAVFEFVSCSNGDVFEMCDSNPNKGEVNILVSQLGTKDTNKNGVIATVNLKIKDIVDDGVYEIKIDPETNFSDIEGELKEIAFEGCKVTVK